MKDNISLYFFIKSTFSMENTNYKVKQWFNVASSKFKMVT